LLPIVLRHASLQAYTFLILSGSVLYTIGGFRASLALHTETMARIIKAPFSWFQDTPIGRITSRFTTDLGTVLCL
jgi:ABC-type multidrug transport system fused ATPase/permease subunit